MSYKTEQQAIDSANTGLVSWGGSGNYYSYTGGTFTILRAGVGRINGQKVAWAGGESVAGLTSNKGYLIGFNSSGVLTATDISTLVNSNKHAEFALFDAFYTSHITVFGIWTDGAYPQIVKEDHPYGYSTDISVHDHFKFGQTFTFGGALLSVLTAASRTIQTSGEDMLDDHGLTTRISDRAGNILDCFSIFQNGSGIAQALARTGFNVSGVSVTPTAGAVYSNNGNQYTVFVSALVAGAGLITTWTSTGVGIPEVSGTLTKVSGTGDATIAFTSYTIPTSITYTYAPAGVPTLLGSSGGNRYGIIAIYASKDDKQTPNTTTPLPKYFQIMSNTAYGSASDAANSIGTGTSPNVTQFIMPPEMRAIELVLNGFVIIDGSPRDIEPTNTNGFVIGVKTVKASISSASSGGSVTATTANNVSLDTANFNGRLTSSEVNAQLAMDKLDDNITAPELGGTGVANNAAATLTRSGNHAMTLTTTAPTSVTLPTTGTLATTAVVTTGFDGNLSSAENTIQNAFDKIDNFRLNGQETNYIENPSAKNVITGWFAVNDLAVSRSSTASELPRENTTLTGIKIVADADTQSAADYVYYDFTLDDVDAAGRIMKLKWDQKILATYAAGQLEVVITSQADRTTALVTPFTTAIPASDGTFQTYFLAPSTTTLSLVIRATADMTAADGICISDVVVGPNVQVQGSAIGNWESWTPTGSWTTNTTYTGVKRVVGGNEEYRVKLLLAGAPTSANLTVNLPSGSVIDTTKITDSVYKKLGSGFIYDQSGAVYEANVFYNNTTSVYIRYPDDTAPGIETSNIVTQAAPITFANLDQIDVTFTAPIVGLSSNVTLANRALEEYSFNSSGLTTAGASDTTAFAYGPSGAAIGSIASTTAASSTLLYVKFNQVIQPTDRVIVEVDMGSSGGTWVEAALRMPLVSQHTSTYGIGIYGISSTQVAVGFGNKGVTPYGNSTYASDGSAWSTVGTWKWRVRKVSGGASVGYPISSANIVGRTDGVAPASGMVGQRITASGPTAGSLTTSFVNKSTLAIPSAGEYLVCYTAILGYATGANSGDRGFCYAQVRAANDVTVINDASGIYCETRAAASNQIRVPVSKQFMFTATAAGELHLGAYYEDITGSGSGALYNAAGQNSTFFAVRIA